MEQVDVPLVRRVVRVEQALGAAECAADLRAAIFPQVVERVLVDLLRADVVDDVAAFDALVVLAQPGVDPEAFEPHEFLLLFAHRAGDVHHEDDDRVALRALHFLPAAVTDVLLLRDDDGVVRVVIAGHDLPAQGFLEAALEVPKRIGADRADAAVLVPDRRDAVLALGLNAREFQLLRQNLGQLIEREIDLHDVRAGLGAALGFTLAGLALADDVALFPVARADAGGVVAVAEVRQLDPAHGDADQVLAFLADQLTFGEELAQVLPNPAFHDLPEALVIFF